MIEGSGKDTLTRAEYLQLLGLLTLAKRHYMTIESISHAAQALTGEDNQHGVTDEAVWTGDVDVDALLVKLGMTVEE